MKSRPCRDVVFMHHLLQTGRCYSTFLFLVLQITCLKSGRRGSFCYLFLVQKSYLFRPRQLCVVISVSGSRIYLSHMVLFSFLFLVPKISCVLQRTEGFHPQHYHDYHDYHDYLVYLDYKDAAVPPTALSGAGAQVAPHNNVGKAGRCEA